jgi:hypothetical protein
MLFDTCATIAWQTLQVSPGTTGFEESAAEDAGRQFLVQLPDHHRFDDWQQFGHGERRHAEGVTERQRRRHVQADHGARQHAQLTAEAADEVPDLPTLRSFRTVQPRRAVRAGLRAGFAVALAPAEGPLGESAEAFFSCSSNSPFET